MVILVLATRDISSGGTEITVLQSDLFLTKAIFQIIWKYPKNIYWCSDETYSWLDICISIFTPCLLTYKGISQTCCDLF